MVSTKDIFLFQSNSTLEQDYVADPVLQNVIHMSVKLDRPMSVEGPPGCGESELGPCGCDCGGDTTANGHKRYLNSKPSVLPVERMSEVEKGQSCSTFSKSARSHGLEIR